MAINNTAIAINNTADISVSVGNNMAFIMH